MLKLNNELSKLIVRDAELKAVHDAVAKSIEQLSQQVADSIRRDSERLAWQQRLNRLQMKYTALDERQNALEVAAAPPEAEITVTPLAEKLQPPGAAPAERP